MLTGEQQLAVEDQSPLVAVSAKPGSGKTRVVAAKVQQLVSQGIEPWVLTFTAKAGQEISDRIEEQHGIRLAKCGTFHSVFFDHNCGIASEIEEKNRAAYWKEEGLVTYDMILQHAIDNFSNLELPTHVIVDECQDNDKLQWDLVRLMMDAGVAVMVVGDLDQSIYGWRDAEPETALQFFDKANADYGSMHILSKNFRCHPEIQSFAESALANEHPAQTDLVRVQDFGDFVKEGANVDAVLCRTNRDVFLATRLLQCNGIDVSVAVDRKSLQKFQAWMGLLADPFSTSKFVAATGCKNPELAKIRMDSMRRECSLIESHSRVVGTDSIVNVVGDLHEQLTPQIIRDVYLQFCGGDEVAAHQLSSQFGSHSPRDAAIESCVSMLTPVTDGGIRVMTMHGAKGLEFDRVAIVSSSGKQALYGELARLLYVAITRARQEVIFLKADCFSPVGLHLFDSTL